MTIAIGPRFLDAREWTARTTPLLVRFGTIPQLLDPERWREWAAYVASLPRLSAVNAPRPERFDAWQDWAAAFNVTLQLIGAGA